MVLELDERTLLRAMAILALELGAERVRQLADRVEHSSTYNEPERLAAVLRLVVEGV